MIDLRSFRFLIPPFIMFFVISLAMFTDPAENLKIIQNRFPSVCEQMVNFGSVFLGAVILAFAFGFVISTIGISIIRILYWFRSKYKFLIFRTLWNGPAVNWEWDPKAKAKLEDLFDIQEWKQDGEFCEHAVLSKIAESLRCHVQRKWEFFQTNLNSSIGVVLAILIIKFLLNIEPGVIGYFLICVFAGILGINGFTSYKDAMRMDHFILRNLERLSNDEKGGGLGIKKIPSEKG
ncbi:MAG: hypothetical protein A2169_10440 [Deltaproteobacteria bacterium RBG_13_47_9]|nr:MAG: hypothetical protein A2169_10440 [Deltaproteobacteria bacterium RBG_13_47_9]